jgi:hypothetical protein
MKSVDNIKQTKEYPIRVFPRKTTATPNDHYVRIGYPGLFDEKDQHREIHVSVTFTWDLEEAKRIAHAWDHYGNVKIGGPAFEKPAGEFTPGMYLRHGYTITSRGCPNRCSFCRVWRIEKSLKTLEIQPGHILQDDNILACPEKHINAVFDMLRQQHEPAHFKGGLEARLLKSCHIELFQSIRVGSLWFAYDEPADYEPLVEAGRLINAAGYNTINKKARAYVLCGYPGDTIKEATDRMIQTIQAGFVPFAMVVMDQTGKVQPGWSSFQRTWTRPAAMHSFVKQYRRI